MKFVLHNAHGFDCDHGECYIANLYNMSEKGRKFGNFNEKTLICNETAHDAINLVCYNYGFEPGSKIYDNIDNKKLFIFTKLPVFILIKLMLTLKDETIVKELTGAYPIAMNNEICTCMNVIVGRRIDESGNISIDKFSLYYPKNEEAYSKYNKNWPILKGYSFRTAVLNGTLNRSNLNALRNNTITSNNRVVFNKDSYGLIIDDCSEYEDCAYVSNIEGESNEELHQRIKTIVTKMVEAYGGQIGILAVSYDIKEKQENITAIESEFRLFEKYAM